MGTNHTKNAAPTGTNRTRNGFVVGKRWNEATEAWEDVTDTWATYGEVTRNVSGTNRTRNS